jgi:hypothetical protein
MGIPTLLNTTPNKSRHSNPYQPPCFDVSQYLQPQPRDRRAPPLVVVHALIVRQQNETFRVIHSGSFYSASNKHNLADLRHGTDRSLSSRTINWSKNFRVIPRIVIYRDGYSHHFHIRNLLSP